MKKILLVAVVAMLWFSCKKSSSSNSGSNLSGKWYITSDSTAEFTNGTLTNHSTTVYPSHVEYFQFNSDGSGIIVSSADDEISSLNYTYKVSGNSLTFNFPKQIVGQDTVYASVEPATITILTSSKFEFQITQSETDNGVIYKEFEQDDFVR